ncbi:MAG TPA: HupE/UreJ family protein [Pirellulales bacterium]|jgi:urease accessory protein|nr:HupE/UreJ family protein [Pirellulales bacterium]
MSAARRWIWSFCAWLTVVFCAQPAFAHPGHAGSAFADGWLHPFSGLDHLLAMIAVGLLAVRLGGRALWIVPGSFLGGMLLGGLTGAAGLPCPHIEAGITASVLVLGLLVAASRAVPLAAGVAIVTIFAVLHGHAHAAEMIPGGSLAAYAAGFLLATALLHAAGIVAGVALAAASTRTHVRALGGAIAAAGLLLCLGWI